MFGVIKETFESDGGSIKGDDDFFSVAKTMPLVAIVVISSTDESALTESEITSDSQ